MAIGRPITLTDNVASKILSVTATDGQTQFTVSGGYRINAIAAYRNGVRLVDGSDFTATDGSIVTLLSGANLDDKLEFQIFDDFRVADAIVSTKANQTIEGDVAVIGTLSGAAIGIQSSGSLVGSGKTLNFIGAGNTFRTVGDTIEVSIAGGGGGAGLGTAVKYEDSTSTPFQWIPSTATVDSNLTVDADNAGMTTSYVVSVIPNITIVSGVAVTVGTGKTMIIDVLQLGGL
mgnify:CR=1 FL=1|jgi:hypothetical protein